MDGFENFEIKEREETRAYPHLSIENDEIFKIGLSRESQKEREEGNHKRIKTKLKHLRKEKREQEKSR